jgi:hypothetical protein
VKYFLEAAFCAAVYFAIFAAWWRFLHRFYAIYAASFQIVFAATLVWAQIYCTIFALGLCGVLYRAPALAINAGITCLLFWQGRGPVRPRNIVRKLAAWVRDPRKWRNGTLPILLVGALALAWFATLDIALPAGGYDDFAFHVPGAAYFVQEHRIARFEVAPPVSAINTAPKCGELLSVWQFFISGNDRLVNFWNLGMFLLYVAAVYGICRDLGSTRRNAAAGAVLSALAPVCLWQTFSAYDDLPACAFFAVALRFAVYAKQGPLNVAALAVSLGLLLGSKASAPALCACVLGVFCVAELTAKPPRTLPAIAVRAAVIVGIACLIGGWYYLQDLRVYGNPFYPFELKVAGFRLPGSISRSAELTMLSRDYANLPMPVRLWKLWREEKGHFGLWLYNYDSAYAGFGPIFFILGLPSWTAACILTLLNRRWLAASALLLTAGAYLAFSGNISARLSLFILTVIAVGIALTLSEIDAVASFRKAPDRGWMSAGIRWLGFGLAVYTFLVAGMSGVAAETIRTQLYTSPREKDFVAGTFLNAFGDVRAAIPPHSTIAYDTSDLFLWPLWRSDWDNRVLFISSSIGWDKWQTRAAALGITHVAIGKQGNLPGDWMQLHREHFRLVKTAYLVSLYAYVR